MQFRKSQIWYIIGGAIALAVFGIDKAWFLFMLMGIGIGLILHGWVSGILTDMSNTFYDNESRKREMKKRDLENQLEKLKIEEEEELKTKGEK